MKRKLRIGTRESKLALFQTEICIDKIIKLGKYEREDIEIVKIKTSGDKILNKSLSEIGGKALFTKEIEMALLENHIDLAVHSLKDFTANTQKGTILAAFFEREDPRDAIVSLTVKNISDLTSKHIIGTSSSRRKSQLLHKNPHLNIQNLRGNIVSRIEKIQSKDYDSAILAVAGLKRIGVDLDLYTPISTDEILPAPGQGIICLQCTTKNDYIIELCRILNNLNSEICATTERAYVQALQANCNTPIAALCSIIDDSIELTTEIYSQDGTKRYCSSYKGLISDNEKIGLEAGINFKKYVGL